MNDSDLKNYLEPSLYRILCVERNATPKQIKQNFRGMMKVFHPDKNPTNQDGANEKSQELIFAHTVLSNATYKPKYDKIYDEYSARKEQIRKQQEAEKVKKQQEEVRKKQAENLRKTNTTSKAKIFTPKQPVMSPGLEALQGLTDSLKEFMKYMQEEQKRNENKTNTNK